MQSPHQRRSFLNWLGIGILIVGIGAGEFIWSRSLREQRPDGDDAGPSPYESRVYERTMERMSGKFGALMDQWTRAIAGLGEPRLLAITIGVCSMLAAGACFFLASRFPRE
jgi:hypothetical protein